MKMSNIMLEMKNTFNPISKLSTFWNLNRRFCQIYKKWGLNFALNCSLSYFGIKSYMTVKYENFDVEAMVRCMPFWKESVEMGKWEPKCLKFLSGIVREGDIVFDVGAWVGPYSLFFSKLVGSGGRVIAFEPTRKSFNMLVDNLNRNEILNVFPKPCGLCNFVGTMEFRGYGRGISMVKYKKGQGTPLFYAKCTTIDKYCREHKIVPDGMKIDVEGAEGLVIEGAANVIKSYSPWALIEFHGALLTEEENNENWRKITKYAKELIFIEGRKSKYQYKDKIASKPEGNFHMFVRY
jgi:FkbM family methyltransferase